MSPDPVDMIPYYSRSTATWDVLVLDLSHASTTGLLRSDAAFERQNVAEVGAVFPSIFSQLVQHLLAKWAIGSTLQVNKVQGPLPTG
jgi:hypothetical protein